MRGACRSRICLATLRWLRKCDRLGSRSASVSRRPWASRHRTSSRRARSHRWARESPPAINRERPSGLYARVTTDVYGQKRFGDYLSFRLCSTALALAIIFGIALTSRYRWQLTAIILMVGLGQAIEAISDIYYARLQLKDRLDRISKSMIARTVLSAVGLSAGVYFGQHLLWGLAGILLARAIVLAGYDIRGRTHDLHAQPEGFPQDNVLKPRWDLRSQREVLWLGLPLGIIAVLASLI